VTVLTDTQVVTASGGLVELGYSQITSSVTVSSASTGTAATSVISPLTVVCDGSPVLIEFSAVRVDSGASSNLTISLLKDGVEFSRTWGFINPGGTSVPVKLTFRDTPTAGSHTYEVRSWYGGANSGLVAAGSGTTSNSPAFLRVSKIVQATQWPAVTTGTIICTSSTRPASPFAGQQIYETDTSLSYTYSGSAWVQTGNLGAWTTFVPTLTQSGAVTKTVTSATYTQVGKLVIAQFNLSVTGAGTGGTGVLMGLPVTASGSLKSVGTCAIYDTSASTTYGGTCTSLSTTTVGFVGDWAGANTWGSQPSLALASGDVIRGTLMYETA